jgi:hypothetical protein
LLNSVQAFILSMYFNNKKLNKGRYFMTNKKIMELVLHMEVCV